MPDPYRPPRPVADQRIHPQALQTKVPIQKRVIKIFATILRSPFTGVLVGFVVGLLILPMLFLLLSLTGFVQDVGATP